MGVIRRRLGRLWSNLAVLADLVRKPGQRWSMSAPLAGRGLRRLGRLWIVLVSLAGLGLLALYGWLIWRAPVLLVPDLRTPLPTPSGTAAPTLSPAERATATYNSRVLVISLAGAMVVLTGLLYTARNYRLSHRGQVTDRFTKALERLGSSELYVRIGGIHALHQVLRDSPQQHEQVLDVLVAFIRERAPRAASDDSSPIYPQPALPAEPAADVQAALTALAHRRRRPDRELDRLNLAGLHLAGVRMAHGKLQRANLCGVQMQGASLHDAHLQGASLADAQMQGVSLDGARLQEANLEGAQLQRAYLYRARLTGANLSRANLQNGRLNWARLKGAKLIGAELQEAYLDNAKLTGANLWRAQLQGASLRRAYLKEAILDEVRLHGADLLGKEKEGEHPARGLTIEQLASASFDEKTLLPDGLREAVQRYRASTGTHHK